MKTREQAIVMWATKRGATVPVEVKTSNVSVNPKDFPSLRAAELFVEKMQADLDGSDLWSENDWHEWNLDNGEPCDCEECAA